MSYTNGIANSPLLHTLLSQADTVGQVKASHAGSVGPSATQDSAQLSTTASALQQTDTEDVARAQKVSSLQAAVASGSYSVPAEAVADRILQSLLQR